MLAAAVSAETVDLPWQPTPRSEAHRRERRVRSAADLSYDHRSTGLGNDPVPDHSRTAPNPMIQIRVGY
jgi:hypothetical protein